jgi:hypothetical protein
MLRRISVLFSVILAACIPTTRSNAPAPQANSCQNAAPTAIEASEWRRAQRVNTREAYRAFLMKYPRSCYAPFAALKMQRTVQQQPVVVRRMPPPRSRATRPTPVSPY